MSTKHLKGSKFQPVKSGEDRGHRAQIAADIEAKYGPVGDLVDFFVSHTGEGVNKWHHYLPLYERYLGRWRNRPLRFLEIGVAKGGSLEMWRKYFGPDAIIYGIDVNPNCARFNGVSGQVRIGSQADRTFLDSVVDEMGGVDVVLDDGSHKMNHIQESLSALFPRLSIGGTYIVEDLHAAYWKEFGGGLTEPANFFNTVRELIDDMHVWCHDEGISHAPTAGQVTGIHVHDSLVVLDKNIAYRPVRSKVTAITE